jgi:uncharacterized repeat protein (TIGR03803 family)
MQSKPQTLILIIGLLVAALPVLSAPDSFAQRRFKVLYAFSGGTDGAYPQGQLTHDAANNIYGTTAGGGGNCPGFGCGTIFKIDAQGNETVLYRFFGGEDGAWPSGALVRDATGVIYGTTSGGGADCGTSGGCGTVFKLDKTLKKTVLHRFTGLDGDGPTSGLVMDTEGILYGTTQAGGLYNEGTVFRIDKRGKMSVIHSFSFWVDGACPCPSLHVDSSGNLYGVTFDGGGGEGAVFKLSENLDETVLYAFSGMNGDGRYPYTGLSEDRHGNLYGATAAGGTQGDNGTIFEVTPDGRESVLYSFRGTPDGSVPVGLLRDVRGNFYGTARAGGEGGCSYGCGTVFRLSRNGVEGVLHRFTGGADGATPYAGLVVDNGVLYGTTFLGGAYNRCNQGCGVIFKLVP